MNKPPEEPTPAAVETLDRLRADNIAAENRRASWELQDRLGRSALVDDMDETQAELTASERLHKFGQEAADALKPLAEAAEPLVDIPPHPVPPREATLGDALDSTTYPEKLYRDDEIIKIDPTMGQFMAWATTGARCLWIPRSGKKRLLATIKERLSQDRFRIETQNGDEINVRGATIHQWVEGDVPVGSTTAAPGEIKIDTAADPRRVDPRLVERVVAKVRGKLMYDGTMAGAGECLRLLASHGRKLVVTLHLLDGTKQRYRGNGSRLQ